jgi:cytochrome c peroxidase
MRAVKRSRSFESLRVTTLLGACVLAVGPAGAAGCDEPSGPAAAPSASAARAPATASAAATANASAATAPAKVPMTVPAGVLPELAYLPALKIPEENPLTREKIELGKILFFDKRLGKDDKYACESCHFVDKGWADAKQVSTKADGKDNTRHTPALWNVGYQELWYWDGRAATLEGQVLAAWKGQMGGEPDKVAAELAKLDAYKERFKAAFGEGEIKPEHVINALASFVRSIRSGNAPFDKWQQGDPKAVSESAQRGWEIFRRVGCAVCHAPPLFTDHAFHNTGVGYDKPEPDKGRAAATKDPKDEGKFKTPSLRSVSTHPPYLHDGSAKTLEDAIDFMLGGGRANPGLDGQLKPVKLDKQQRDDLVAFVRSLEAPAEPFERPKIP